MDRCTAVSVVKYTFFPPHKVFRVFLAYALMRLKNDHWSRTSIEYQTLNIKYLLFILFPESLYPKHLQGVHKTRRRSPYCLSSGTGH